MIVDLAVAGDVIGQNWGGWCFYRSVCGVSFGTNCGEGPWGGQYWVRNAEIRVRKGIILSIWARWMTKS